MIYWRQPVYQYEATPDKGSLADSLWRRDNAEGREPGVLLFRKGREFGKFLRRNKNETNGLSNCSCLVVRRPHVLDKGPSCA